MGVNSNKPIDPIMSVSSLRRNKAHQYNNMGISALQKTTNKSTGHINRVKSVYGKKRTSSTKDLFKF